jgi:integrase
MTGKKQGAAIPLKAIKSLDAIKQRGNDLTPLFHRAEIGSSTPSRTDKTRAEYMRRAKNIVSEIEILSGSDTITPTDIAEWLVMRASALAPATIRQYRAALTHYLKEQSSSGCIDQHCAESAINAMKSIRSQQNLRNRTSALKAKFITTRQINALANRLESKRSIFAKAALLMFKASLVAGLRPSEWFSASISPAPDGSGDGILVVQNAKNSNGRCFGDIRTLIIPAGQPLDDVTACIKYLSDLMLRPSMPGRAITPKRIYNEARAHVLAANISHGGKRVTLYTARHQFTANMKNIYSKEEVALLLGHGSIETATRHYGKRRSGHPEFKQVSALKHQSEQNCPHDR